MTLGERIKQCRQDAAMSQEKLAELLGVSRQAVTKWEADQSLPSTENLFRLADLFHTTVDSLVHPERDSAAVPPPKVIIVRETPQKPAEKPAPTKWTIFRKISLWLFIIALIALIPIGVILLDGGLDDDTFLLYDIFAYIYAISFYGGVGCQFVDLFIRISKKEF